MFNGAGLIGGPMPGPGGNLASCPACGAPDGGEGVPLPPAAAREVAPPSGGSAPCDVISTACEPTDMFFRVNITLSDPNDPVAGTVVVVSGPMQVTATAGEFGVPSLYVTPGGPYIVSASRSGYHGKSELGGPIPGGSGCSTTIGLELQKET